MFNAMYPSWSSNSRWILTSSKDWNVIKWDLASQCDPIQRMVTIRFDGPVISASFHPRNSNIALALLSSGEAYVEDLRRKSRSRVELREIQQQVEDGQSNRSRWYYYGLSKMIARHKISGAAGIIKALAFAKSGRTLRQFNLPVYKTPACEGEFVDDELEPTHRFHDPINKTGWYGMSYSPDGEWLAGGATDTASHKIYIWDISNDGQFASALDGGREPLVDIHWHPLKSLIVSTTKEGNVLLWHSPNPERWGAFAGGFEEVDENVEYEEREDEFDIEDEEEIMKRKMKVEDEEVDIDTIVEDTTRCNNLLEGLVAEDEDTAWAACDRDDVGEFRMKIIMQEDIDE
ncbi:hypothetical protein C0993_011631 [Termitomyces sp. T159_Od127]|nr:hypothetical protein C0993_011631 [Termitomyces sp. T159_Od127]